MSAGAAQAENIWKWRDANGIMQFSDQPRRIRCRLQGHRGPPPVPSAPPSSWPTLRHPRPKPPVLPLPVPTPSWKPERRGCRRTRRLQTPIAGWLTRHG
ncbi:MAG: DUF4124 domain-containing protein [Burkholderiales bacterium]|nr:DUF4124 domain-containing protein [Burkholderiales bacterium]